MTKRGKMYQMTTKFAKVLSTNVINIPKGRKIFQMTITYTYVTYQHFPIQGPPKYAQMGIFGMKIYSNFDFWYDNILESGFLVWKYRYHLATLIVALAPKAQRDETCELTGRVTRWVFKKNRPKCRTTVFVRINTRLLQSKKVTPKMLVYFGNFR
jgi:hypothetical protein